MHVHTKSEAWKLEKNLQSIFDNLSIYSQINAWFVANIIACSSLQLSNKQVPVNMSQLTVRASDNSVSMDKWHKARYCRFASTASLAATLYPQLNIVRRAINYALVHEGKRIKIHDMDSWVVWGQEHEYSRHWAIQVLQMLQVLQVLQGCMWSYTLVTLLEESLLACSVFLSIMVETIFHQ